MRCRLFYSLLPFFCEGHKGESTDEPSPSGDGSADNYKHEGYEEEEHQWKDAPDPQFCVAACKLEYPCFSRYLGSCQKRNCEPDDSTVYLSSTASTNWFFQKKEDHTCTCPPHTVDTACNNLSLAARTIAFLVSGFQALFFLLFIRRAYYWRLPHTPEWNAQLKRIKDWRKAGDGFGGQENQEGHGPGVGYEYLSHPMRQMAFSCLITSLAYLTVATHNGYKVMCDTGREVYFAIFLAWLITVPLQVDTLNRFGSPTRPIYYYLMFGSIFMLYLGLMASVSDGAIKWIFFGIAMLLFIPMIWMMCTLKTQSIDHTLPYANFFSVYSGHADVVVITWMCYPIIWILAEGTGHLCVSKTVIAYAILDLLSKWFFGIRILGARRNHVAELFFHHPHFNHHGKDGMIWFCFKLPWDLLALSWKWLIPKG